MARGAVKIGTAQRRFAWPGRERKIQTTEYLNPGGRPLYAFTAAAAPLGLDGTDLPQTSI